MYGKCPDTATSAQLAHAWVQPAYNCFKEKFEGELALILTAFKSACLCPSQGYRAQAYFWWCGYPQKLPIPKLCSSDCRTEIRTTRLPCQGRRPFPPNCTNGVVGGKAEKLVHWSAACKSILCLQPSSSAAEWIFSLLKNSFNEEQYSSLEDYIEASIMLQYNH